MGIWWRNFAILHTTWNVQLLLAVLGDKYLCCRLKLTQLKVLYTHFRV
jgi:hypothetical protein